MKGRSLTTLLPLLALAARGVTAQQDQPGNPTTLAGFQITPTIKIAVIAGAGGLLILIILLVTVCCCRRRRKKKRLPAASTPVGGSFSNPDSLPQAPLSNDNAQATTATFDARPPGRQLSDRLPQNPTPYGDYGRGATPAPPSPAYTGYSGYGGYDDRTGTPMDSMATRRGADPPPKLRMGATPHPPSGAGLDGFQQPPRAGGWAAVGQAQAWGMHGRHIDQQGQYYGSVAQQGGQAPPPRGARQAAMQANKATAPPPARGKALPRDPPATYGDDAAYSQRAYAQDEEAYSAHELTENPGGNRYAQGRNPYGAAQYSPPNPGYGGGGARGTPHATNQDRYANQGYAAPQGGYGDYGAGHYGHTRDGSAESDHSYYNYGAQRPTAPNRWV